MWAGCGLASACLFAPFICLVRLLVLFVRIRYEYSLCHVKDYNAVEGLKVLKRTKYISKATTYGKNPIVHIPYLQGLIRSYAIWYAPYRRILGSLT